MTNTSHKILATLLKDDESEGPSGSEKDMLHLQEKYLLLKHIHEALCHRGQVDVLQSQYVIFMLTKLLGQVPPQVVKYLET